MIKTTILNDNDATLEIHTIFPCIPPKGIEIFVKETENMYTIQEVSYSIEDQNMILYVKPYTTRKTL